MSCTFPANELLFRSTPHHRCLFVRRSIVPTFRVPKYRIQSYTPKSKIEICINPHTCSIIDESLNHAVPAANSPAATITTSTPRGLSSCRRHIAKPSMPACVAHCAPLTGAGIFDRAFYDIELNFLFVKKISCMYMLVLEYRNTLPEERNTTRPFVRRMSGSIICVNRAAPVRFS